MFKTWREYFHFSYLNEATLDPNKTYIFVEFPHGVFPMSELIAGGAEAVAAVPWLRVLGAPKHSSRHKQACVREHQC